MRRPLFICAINLSVGAILQYYLDFDTVYILALAGIILLLGRKHIMIFIAVGMLLMTMETYELEKLQENLNKEVTVYGVPSIIEKRVDEKGGFKTSFLLKNDEGDKFQCVFYGKIRKGENFSGEKLKVRGILKKPQVRRNPRCFDYNLHMKSKGIGYIIECEEVTLQNEKSINLYWKTINKICTIRDQFLETMEKNLGEKESAILTSLMFGTKDNLDEKTYESFQKNGTAHLLATSGLHVAILYGFMINILGGKRHIITNIFIMIILMIYIVMADFNISILRAVIMIGIKMVANIFHYRYDIISAVSLTYCILLAINPMSIFNMGFQMSFLAIYIIGVTFGKEDTGQKRGGIRKKLTSLLIMQGGMTPFIMYNFNYLSVSALIANIPVAVVGTLLLPMGILAIPITVFTEDITFLYWEMLSVITKFFLYINDFTYMKGILTIDVVSPSLFLVLVIYGTIYFITDEGIKIFWMRGQKGKILIRCTAIIVFISIVASFNVNEFDKADVIFIDVGQGNGTLFREEGKTILVDGGGKIGYDVGKKIVKPMLLKNGVDKVDIAVVTHLDEDHYGGIKYLAKEGMIDKILIYEGNKTTEKEIIKECGIEKNQILYGKKGDSIKIGESMAIEIIAPEQKSLDEYKDEYENETENSRSMVLKVFIKEKIFLMTGDIDKNIEENLEGNIEADVMQVPHHGSGGSSSVNFLEKVNPEIGIFQVGKNNYGHPSPDVIEKYRKKCIITFRNDLSGAVGISITDGAMKIYEMIKERDKNGK